MDRNLLLQRLRDSGISPVTVLCQPSTGSTNRDAREQIDEGASLPLLITADTQSSGRGRQGKIFLSPPGGLYMTLAFPSGEPIDAVISITSAAAVAVCRAVYRVCSFRCGIKWVNDIYAGDKKLAGILVESVNNYETMRSEYLIIGVGMNLTASPDVSRLNGVPAVSLADLGITPEPEALCAAIAEELLRIRDCGYRFSDYADEYRQLSLVLGREITFTRNGLQQRGRAIAIGDGGELMVRTPDSLVTLTSGEISVRISDESAQQLESQSTD